MCGQAAGEGKARENPQWAADGLAESIAHGKGPKHPLHAYIDEVIKRLHADEGNFDAQRRKEVKELEKALRSLQLVRDARLSSFSTVPFDSNLDDTEVLLLLMREVDVDGNGSISERELLASSGLNPEMRRAFESAFGCDQVTVEEALAHLVESDFVDFFQMRNEDSESEGIQPRGAFKFDKKSTAQAVFKAALRATAISLAKASNSAACNDADGQGSQERTHQAPVVQTAVSTAEAGGAVLPERVTKAGLEELASKLGCEKSKLAVALNGLAKTLLSEGVELDFLAVKRAARRVPRVAGQRIEWAKRVELDALLARQMQPGNLEDGLAGLRAMSFDEVQAAVAAFLEEARVEILEAVLEAKKAKGSKSAHEANSKFAGGFEGSFASLKDFHAGAEASLNLGYPNPDTMKGMRQEHTEHPSAQRLFLTPNYRLVTSLHIEYAWAMYEECPDDQEVKKLLQKAQDLLRELAAARDGDAAASAAVPAEKLLFPGEVGDSFSESLVILTFPGVEVGSAVTAKACEAAAKAKAEALLTTNEERVRGVTTLDHGACVERIQRGASVLLSEPNDQAAIVDSSLRVGVMLPMSPTRAKAIVDELRKAVADAVGSEVGEVVTAEPPVMGCTWAFSKHPGVDELRSWLAEQSFDDLKKLLANDEERRSWSLESTANFLSHETLCEAMVTSFVRTELRADLLAALESGASDAQIEELLKGWSVPEPWSAARAERIKQAAAALDSEDKWRMVEGWVRLHRGRIQGRTRLGLKALMEREKVLIQRYKLTNGEVLGVHIYTGAAFVPLNSICRNFPMSMLDLLKGDGVMADNRLCTTLFCISSALKKLSQGTEMPENRCCAPARTRFERAVPALCIGVGRGGAMLWRG